MYSQSLAMSLAVSYILYATSSHKQTGSIKFFAQFEKGSLVENKHNAKEDKSILASINESSTDDNFDDGYMSKNYLEDIWDIQKLTHDIMY